MLRCLSQLRPSREFVLIVGSLITLFSFAMNIGLALGQLRAYNLTFDDAWMHTRTLAIWPEGSGSPILATRLRMAALRQYGPCALGGTLAGCGSG